MPLDKPYSESCDQNRDPILNIIGPVLTGRHDVLEIGSGTGQHAVYFAERLPGVTWQCSDRSDYHAGIDAWIAESGLENIRHPIELDVSRSPWPERRFDAVFSANTCHIMHWQDVMNMFTGIGRILGSEGDFLLYGPFNYNGRYTSESNASFDRWLKSRDSGSGIRDFDALDDLAEGAGLTLIDDHAMPANNRILHWRKR